MKKEDYQFKAYDVILCKELVKMMIRRDIANGKIDISNVSDYQIKRYAYRATKFFNCIDYRYELELWICKQLKEIE